MNGVYSIEIRGRGEVGTRGARRCRAPAADGSRGGQDAQKGWGGRPDSQCEWEWVKTLEVCFIFFQIEKGAGIVYKKEKTSFCLSIIPRLAFLSSYMRMTMKTFGIVSLLLFLAPIAGASTWSGQTANWDSNENPGWNGTGVPNGQGAEAYFSTKGNSTLVEDITLGLVVYSGNSDNDRQIKLSTAVLTLDRDGDGPEPVIFRNEATHRNGRLSISSGKIVLQDDLLLDNVRKSTGTYSINISGSISGTGNVIIRNIEKGYSTGSIRLVGSNSFYGEVWVESGTFMFNNSAFGYKTNTIHLGKTGGGDAAIISLGTRSITPNPIEVAADAGGTLLLGANITNELVTTYSGNITLGGDLVLMSEKLETGDVLFSGTISGDGVLRKIGQGPLTLSKPNDFTGGVVIEEGTVNATSADALGTGDLTILAGGRVVLGAEACISPAANLICESNDVAQAAVSLPLEGVWQVQTLTVNNQLQVKGVYGAIGSGAQYESSLFDGVG